MLANITYITVFDPGYNTGERNGPREKSSPGGPLADYRVGVSNIDRMRKRSSTTGGSACGSSGWNQS